MKKYQEKMKKYERNMKEYLGNMTKYEGKMKEYEGIYRPRYGSWDIKNSLGWGNVTRIRTRTEFSRLSLVPKGKAGLPPKTVTKFHIASMPSVEICL